MHGFGVVENWCGFCLQSKVFAAIAIEVRFPVNRYAIRRESPVCQVQTKFDRPFHRSVWIQWLWNKLIFKTVDHMVDPLHFTVFNLLLNFQFPMSVSSIQWKVAILPWTGWTRIVFVRRPLLLWALWFSFSFTCDLIIFPFFFRGYPRTIAIIIALYIVWTQADTNQRKLFWYFSGSKTLNARTYITKSIATQTLRSWRWHFVTRTSHASLSPYIFTKNGRSSVFCLVAPRSKSKPFKLCAHIVKVLPMHLLCLTSFAPTTVPRWIAQEATTTKQTQPTSSREAHTQTVLGQTLNCRGILPWISVDLVSS